MLSYKYGLSKENPLKFIHFPTPLDRYVNVEDEGSNLGGRGN